MAKDKDIRVYITGDSRGAENALDRVSGKAGGLGHAFKAGAMVAGAAIAAIGASLAALAISSVKETTAYAEAVDKMVKQTGNSAEEIQRLAYAAEQEHASMETLGTGFKFLAKNMEGAEDGTSGLASTFKSMGVSVTDANGNLRNTNDVLLETADYFKNSTDEVGKQALAMQLFGRSGGELIPFLEQGSAEISRLGDEAESLGIVLTGSTISAFEQYGDQVNKAKNAWKGFQMAMGTALLPSFSGFTDEITKALGGLKDSGVMDSIFGNMGNMLTAMLPTIEVVVNTIGEMFRTLGPVVTQILQLLGDSLGQILPLLTPMLGPLSAIASILVNGIASVIEALMPIVEAIAPVITGLLVAIAPMIGQIVGAFVQIIQALSPLIPIIVDALAPVIEALMPIIQIIVNAISQLAAIIAPILEQLAPIIGEILGILAEIVSRVLEKLAPHLDKIMDLVMRLIEAVLPILPALLEMLMPILDLILALIDPLMRLLDPILKIAEAITGKLITAVSWIAEAIKGFAQIWQWAWDAIKAVFEFVWNAIVAVWNVVVAPWIAVLSAVFDAVKAVWDAVWNGAIKPILEAVWGAIVGVWNAVVGPLIDGAVAVWDAVKTTWEFVWNVIKGVIEGVWNGIVAVWHMVVDPIISAIEGVWNGVSAAWSGIWEGIKDVFKAAINWCIRAINVLLDGVNVVGNAVDWLIPGDDVIPDLHIPELHTGGLIGGIGEQLRVVLAGEYMIKRPSAAAIGTANLEYMNRTGQVPAGGGGDIYLSFQIDNVYGDKKSLDYLADQVVQRMPAVAFRRWDR